MRQCNPMLAAKLGIAHGERWTGGGTEPAGYP